MDLNSVPSGRTMNIANMYFPVLDEFRHILDLLRRLSPTVDRVGKVAGLQSGPCPTRRAPVKVADPVLGRSESDVGVLEEVVADDLSPMSFMSIIIESNLHLI